MSIQTIDNIFNELFFIRDNHYDDEEILNIINELSEEVRDNKNFYIDAIYSLKNLRKEKGYCPICSESLSHATKKIPHPELCDSFDKEMLYETRNYEYCKLCGWNEKDTE